MDSDVRMVCCIDVSRVQVGCSVYITVTIFPALIYIGLTIVVVYCLLCLQSLCQALMVLRSKNVVEATR